MGFLGACHNLGGHTATMMEMCKSQVSPDVIPLCLTAVAGITAGWDFSDVYCQRLLPPNHHSVAQMQVQSRATAEVQALKP